MNTKPLVVHIIGRLVPNGAERLLVDLLKHRSDRLDFKVLCLASGGPLETELREAGVPVIILGRSGKWDLTLLLRLRRWLRQYRPLAVHTHLFTADCWGRTAAWLARVPGIFSTVHSTNEWKGRIRLAADHLLARFSTKIFACSDAVANVLVRRHHLPAQRVEIIRNGIDLARFSGAVIPADTLTPTRTPGRCEIAVIGRLCPAKGHSDLLQALARLRDQGLGFHCFIVGDGELKSELLTLTQGLSLNPHVSFLGQRFDVPNILARIDILAMPSRWEGLPITLLEGMAMGKAIVATTVGGIPSVIQSGEHGVLVPPGDPAALESALCELINNAEQRARFGANARRHVYAHYDVSTTAAAYEAHYLRVLAARADARVSPTGNP